MPTTATPRVQRKSDNEVVIAAPRSVAFAHVAEAMAKLGSIKQRDAGQNFIDGRDQLRLESRQSSSVVGRA
jgi:hypothetical protein